MASELIDVLRRLLGDPPVSNAMETVDDWWTTHQRTVQPFASTIGRAFAAGFAADRVGFAFASGYEEALASLVPSLTGVKAALCATERGSGHPRDMQTRLEEVEDRFRILGEKNFVTLADRAEELLVVASIGLDDHDRNRLRVVRLPANRDGLRIETLPPGPFVPEVPHGKLILDGVRVERDEVLEGDGYDDYLKPFRTVEDVHVHAAIIGYLIQVGRRSGWSRQPIEDLAALASAIFPLGLVEPLDAAVHVTLGGVIRRFRELLGGLDWSAVEANESARFERDKALLGIAGKVRAARLDTAWARLGRVSMPV